MAGQLAKHGTNAGYKAEIASGKPCERCRRAHLVYNRQYTTTGKRKGLKYNVHEVLDHLYTRDKVGPVPGKRRAPKSTDQRAAPERAPEDLGDYTVGLAPTEPQRAAQGRSGPSLSDRIKGLVMPETEPYVESDEAPSYLHAVEPDNEPDESGWSEVADEAEFVITAAGLKKIEENLGTYLSIVGMTAEMIDPYCGSIAAENFDNMVEKWTRVIAKYPKAAKLFLDTKGGTLFAWIGALQATWPVLYAMYEHHFAKTVQVDKDGRIHRANMNGQVDATMPIRPQDSYAYSAG